VPGVSRRGPGHVAKNGIGTYEQFLRGANLRPPYALPGLRAADREAFQKACEVMARRIVNAVDRTQGIDPRSIRGVVIKGPRQLLRAADGGAEPWGAWWFRDKLYAAAFERTKNYHGQIVPDAQHRHLLREELRRLLAVRYDWNEMTKLYVMSIHSGRFPAVAGRGTKQPPRTGREDDVDLPGGATQYWLPWTPLVALELRSL
jgi:hypothetical protein